MYPTDTSKISVALRISISSTLIAMRALRRSISSVPKVDSQHPQLRAFFRLGRRRDTPQTARGLCSETSSPAGRQSQPLSQVLTPPSGPECAICRSESGDGEMALKVPTEACTHPPQVCIGCLQQVILAAVTSGDFITGIPCPSYDCPQRLRYHDIEKWAAQEVFDRLVPPEMALVDNTLIER